MLEARRALAPHAHHDAVRVVDEPLQETQAAITGDEPTATSQ